MLFLKFFFFFQSITKEDLAKIWDGLKRRRLVGITRVEANKGCSFPENVTHPGSCDTSISKIFCFMIQKKTTSKLARWVEKNTFWKFYFFLMLLTIILCQSDYFGRNFCQVGIYWRRSFSLLEVASWDTNPIAGKLDRNGGT